MNKIHYKFICKPTVANILFFQLKYFLTKVSTWPCNTTGASLENYWKIAAAAWLEVVPNSSAHIKALPAAYSFSFNNSLVQIHLRKSQRMQLKKDWSHPGSHTFLNNLYREHSDSRTSIFFPCPPLYYWIEIKKPYATNVYTRFICVQPNVVCVLVVFFL